jgi:hypothetical protein
MNCVRQQKKEVRATISGMIWVLTSRPPMNTTRQETLMQRWHVVQHAAQRNGWLTRLAPVLRCLQTNGYRIAPALIAAALEAAGEESG